MWWFIFTYSKYTDIFKDKIASGTELFCVYVAGLNVCWPNDSSLTLYLYAQWTVSCINTIVYKCETDYNKQSNKIKNFQVLAQTEVLTVLKTYWMYKDIIKTDKGYLQNSGLSIQSI